MSTRPDFLSDAKKKKNLEINANVGWKAFQYNI